jgi:hypothetical protein
VLGERMLGKEKDVKEKMEKEERRVKNNNQRIRSERE